MSAKSIVIDGITYVPEGSVAPSAPAASLKGKKYCIVRTYSAGVFAGYLAERNGSEATVINARRLWYWDGAASLSQLATDGTSKPSTCKFPCEMPEVTLMNVIEIIPCTAKAQDSIASVKVWAE